ncbi:MAG: alpha-glucuronidase family glycosyl hydrolase, partial [Bacteroidales bacterium]|nr:alpha-glucuronidase family glycosyl hydrolase [Bacteroidales bacterium]
MIRWITLPVILFFSLSGYFSATAQILLADNGFSDYRIVTAREPEAGEMKAALHFQSVFREISSVTLPIVPDSQPDSEKEIVIGNSTRLEKIKSKGRFKDVEDDGFLIYTDQSKLYICGAGDNGLFYGVCSFFENYLGYRYYSPSVKYHPKHNRVIINK